MGEGVQGAAYAACEREPGLGVVVQVVVVVG